MATKKETGTHSSVAFGLIIGVVFLLLCGGLVFLFTDQSSGTAKLEVREQEFLLPITTEYPDHAIELSKKKPGSPTIKLFWSMDRADIAYDVEVDGGKTNGGYEYTVPARNTWAEVGYDPSQQFPYGKEVRFKLTAGQDFASVDLTITKQVLSR